MYMESIYKLIETMKSLLYKGQLFLALTQYLNPIGIDLCPIVSPNHGWTNTCFDTALFRTPIKPQQQ